MRPRQHLADVVRRLGGDGGNGGDYTAAVNALLSVALRRRREVHEKKNPYVTDAGKCPRQVFFSLAGEPESNPFTDDSLANFEVGHAIEQWWADIIAAVGGQMIRNVRIEIPADGTVVSGKPDFTPILLEDAPEFTDTLIELKSTSSRAMAMMLKNGERGKDDHRRQLNLYLHGSQIKLPQFKRAYDTGLLLYIVKDCIKGEPIAHAWSVAYDREQAEADVTGLAAIHAEVKRGATPPQIPSGYAFGKYPCSYCQYQLRCWGGTR